MKIGILVFILTIAFSSVVSAQNPTGIIFDTDMGNDVDDALALAMLHSFPGPTRNQPARGDHHQGQ